MSYDLKIKEAELKDIDAVIEIAKRSFYKYDLKKYGMSFDLDSVEATYKGAVWGGYKLLLSQQCLILIKELLVNLECKLIQIYQP